MMRKFAIMVGFLSLSVFASLSAQTAVPVVDGSVTAGEYARSYDKSGMTFALSVSSDGKTLYAALEAPTTGWVSIGLGSLKMDGAYMVIASDNAGKTTISEETGKGHGHRANATKILISSIVRESNGKTVLEIALPANAYVSGGNLQAIIAYGKKDAINSMHAAFASLDASVR